MASTQGGSRQPSIPSTSTITMQCNTIQYRRILAYPCIMACYILSSLILPFHITSYNPMWDISYPTMSQCPTVSNPIRSSHTMFCHVMSSIGMSLVYSILHIAYCILHTAYCILYIWALYDTLWSNILSLDHDCRFDSTTHDTLSRLPAPAPVLEPW